ncbi:MAG TPA: tetratricopeptide repeat protein [Kiloniellales bacterium]
MKQLFELSMLAIILCLAWLAVARAQQADTSAVGSPVGTGLEQLQTLAEKGDPEAQYRLAEKYRIGFPVDQDEAKAMALYERSAGQGFAASQFRLGELYEEGEMVERDLGKALDSYRAAAHQGHAGAQYALAHIYHLGSGVEQDMAKAMDWYRKAALQGDEWSQLALGDQYRIGLAVPRDLVQSTRWYRKAADRGNIFAQYELGNAYRYGNGVAPDMTKAMAWFRMSAAAGNPSAQLALTELEGGTTAAAGVTMPAPHASRGAGPDGFAYGSEGDRVHSETDMEAVAEEKATTTPTVPEQAPQVAASAPPGSAADRETESSFAAPPRVRDEEAVARLLALAEDQMARLALTTPAGDNAYDTFRQVLSIEPDNPAALDGIEQIGVEYVGLAGLAAAKGDLERARHYAAKATELAPEHPLVRSMTLAQEAAPPTTDEKTEPPELLVNTNSPRRAAPETNEAKTKIEGATPGSAAATPGELIEDANNLIFKPDDYQDRQVTVAGSVVHFLGLYRLKLCFGVEY